MGDYDALDAWDTPAASGPAGGYDALDAWSEPKDMGPEARRSSAPLRGMRPEPKPDDDVTIEPDYTKHDLNKTLQGKADIIRTPEASEAARERASAENPLEHDPLAAMIVQGIPAAGLGTVAAGLTRAVAPGAAELVGGATTGAASSPEDPLTGAAFGAIPGVKGAAQAADRYVGQKALERWTSPPSAPGPIVKGLKTLAERGVHAAVGHSLGGVPGMVASQIVSPFVHDMAAAAGDKLVGSLARRRLAQVAAEAAPVPFTPTSASAARNLVGSFDTGSQYLMPPRGEPAATGFSADSPRVPVRSGPLLLPPMSEPAFAQYIPPARPAGPMPTIRDAEVVSRAPLAPLVPQPAAEPSMPPGLFGKEPVNPFDELTHGGAPQGHATVGGQTSVIPAAEPSPEAFADTVIAGLKKGRTLAESVHAAENPLPPPKPADSLRSDIVKDARAFRETPHDAPLAAENDALARSLQASIDMLGKLRAAKAAGVLTDELVKEARAAGVSPALIRQVAAK